MSVTTNPYIVETNIESISVKGVNRIKSYVRTWIDKESIPYKYEFRGDEFQAYLNPNEVKIIHN